ncbi:MAG: phosphodiesterase [Crocinitomicaceae bacterium]|nr:phosphodiesterase [Crocinitomicaceae bacterium]|tara:strand:- start:36865 stop:38181 length:1317 start_codon:yes stop_codon:yes gene_type:complete
MRLLLFLFIFILTTISVNAQNNLLQAGPMSGYITFREAAIWVQTTESAKVSAVLWSVEQPNNKKRTIPIITGRDNGFTATLIAEDLLPGTTYNYQLEINNEPVELEYTSTIKTPKIWQWREQPPAFSLLTGSCLYVSEKAFDRPGKPYGGDYQILQNMAKQDAQLMLWLGDNTYYREVDWDSKTGIYYRNTHTRSLPELQPLLSKMQHYSIWDDHDFGSNDAVGSFYNKKLTLEAFKDFWANPNYDISGGTGISGQFSYNDIDVFMLDNRWNRTPIYDSAKGKILGKKQLNWLMSSLKNSHASFKLVMVGGQFLNPNKVYENMANYPEERQKLIDFIKDEQIMNVVFLTGDRHHSEVSEMELSETHSIFDITASPITSKAHKKVKEENKFRIKGSLIKERNYAKLSFSGKLKKRVLKIEFFDSENKPLFEHTILQQRL